MGTEEEVNHDKPFWDDESTWSFSLLESEENVQKLDVGSNLQDEKVVKPLEEMPPPPPPPPPPSDKGKNKKKRSASAMKGGGEGKDGGGEPDHEVHIMTERERRKKMRNMFASLHSLLPSLPPKADKTSIVDEAVQYIKNLQQTYETLQKQKVERLNGLSSKAIINYNIPSTSHHKLDMIPFPSREAFLADMCSQNSILTPATPQLFPSIELPSVFKTYTSPNVVINVTGKDALINVICPWKPRLLVGICFVLEKYQLEVMYADFTAHDLNRFTAMIHTHANGGCDMFPMAFQVEEIYRQVAAEIMLWVNS